MKDKIAFKNFMTLLGELFGKEISDTLKNAYWMILQPYSDGQCKKAFEVALTTCKFFPKPSEILELINGNQGEQATLAWLRVHEAVKSVGPYESIDFSDDRAINSAIEAMGGWVHLCQASLDEWKWKRIEFEKLYPTMAQRKNGGHPASLPGIIEIDNTGRGFTPPEVKRITGTTGQPLMLQ